MLPDLVQLALRGLQQRQRKAWQPQPGPQQELFRLRVDEVLYGGAAGGGKTSVIIAYPGQYVAYSGFRGIVLRRSTGRLAELVDEAEAVYRSGREGEFGPIDPGGTFPKSPQPLLRFNSGGSLQFGHCDNDRDWEIYKSRQFDFIAFDELTEFTEEQYLEIKSRLRGTVRGIHRMVLACCNPPKPSEPGRMWVKKRWGPWLDPDCEVPPVKATDRSGNTVDSPGLPPRFAEAGGKMPPAASGQVLYYSHSKDPKKPPLISTVPFVWNGIRALSRTFLLAKLQDNPALLRATPDYEAVLQDNDAVRVRQLADGDWTTEVGSREYFQQEWFGEPLPKAPLCHHWVRAWDRAATEPSPKNKDPDWTRGLLLGRTSDGLFIVADLVSLRGGPGEVDALIKKTAEKDGKHVRVRLPRDPAQAGKAQAAADYRLLSGYDISSVQAGQRKSGGAIQSKIDRIGPVSAQCHPNSTGGGLGRFRVVKAGWNWEFFAELEDCPYGHDDIRDALADAFDELSEFDDMSRTDHGFDEYLKEVWSV